MTAEDPRVADPAHEELLERLLTPVFDCDGADQPAALDAVCAQHPQQASALRRRHAILARLGFASDASSASARLGAPEPPLPGRLGPFRIISALGKGGMGVVYLAEDTGLGRRVALKLIRPEFLDSERARARFRREVAAAARLDHPGICTVYGAGQVDGQPYLTMRYLEGDSLEQQLRTARAGSHGVFCGNRSREASGSSGGRLRPVDLRPALQLVEALARAIHVAHEAGLVHRDVKPGNVMVTADSGQPVLMDFGLARETDGSAASLTQSQDLVGTPAYMAPEQVRGGAVDRRTDVHALGVLLYECLTLRPPYVGRNREELYRSILTETPIDLRRLQPAASRDLATVVHKALAKEPHRRFTTALLLAEDLRALLEDRPTAARPPGPGSLAWGWARRHRAAAAVALAVMLGLVSSLLLLVRSLRAEQLTRLLAHAESLREDPEQQFVVLTAALARSSAPEVLAATNAVLAELQDWQLVRQTSGRVESITRSPAGRWFVVAGNGINAALHRADGTFWCELPWAIGPQQPTLAFSPGEDELIVCHRHRVAGEERTELARCILGGAAVATARFGDVAIAGWPSGLAWRSGMVAITFEDSERGAAQAEVFEATSGRRVRDDILLPAGHGGCDFLPDGRLVVPGGIWPREQDLPPIALPVPPAGPWQQVRRVLVRNDRIALVTLAGVHLFDFDGRSLDGPPARAVEDLTQHLANFEVAADGSMLFTYRDGQILLHEPAGRFQSWKEPTTTFGAHFTPDGQRIVTSDWSGRVTIRDRGGNLLDLWHGHQHGTFCAPVGADGDAVLTGSWDGSVKIWHPGRARGLPHRSGFARATIQVCGDLLVLADKGGKLLAVDHRGDVVHEARLPNMPFFLHPGCDGRSVWMPAYPDGALWRWQPTDGAPTRLSLPVYPGNPPLALAHLESGSLLAGGGYRGPLLIVDPATGTIERRDDLPTMFTAAAAGGRVAVSIDGLGLLRLHDAQGGVVWSEIDPDARRDGRMSAPTGLALDRDGRFAAIAHDDGSVTLWDLQARQRVRRWPSHRNHVLGVALDARGEHVASITSAGHLVVRAVDGDAPLLEAHLAGESLESVVFFGEGAVVTSGWKESGRVRWWWWDPEVLRQHVAGVPQVSPGSR